VAYTYGVAVEAYRSVTVATKYRGVLLPCIDLVLYGLGEVLVFGMRYRGVRVLRQDCTELGL
jgi:hypothetical protein